MFRNLSHMEKLNFDADIISDLIDKCEKEYLDLEEFKMKDASIQDELNLKRDKFDTSANSKISDLKNFYE